MFGLKNQDTKGSTGLVPEKKRFAWKVGILGRRSIIRHRGKLFPKNMLRMESMDFEEAGNLRWAKIGERECWDNFLGTKRRSHKNNSA